MWCWIFLDKGALAIDGMTEPSLSAIPPPTALLCHETCQARRRRSNRSSHS